MVQLRSLSTLLLFIFVLVTAASAQDTEKEEDSWDSGEWDDWKEDVGYSDTTHSLTHWAGIDLAVTGYLSSGQRFTMPNGSESWKLDYARSIGWNLNLFEKRFPLIGRHFGLVTGIGFDWDRYAFEKNVSVDANSDCTWVSEQKIDYDKNKLKTTYLRVPLLFELNTSRIPDKSFHLAAGVIGGWRIHSELDQAFTQNGDDYTRERQADFNIQSFRYSLTTRLGYGKYNLFFEYSPMPFFTRGEGPELYPFSAGVTILGI